MKDTHNGPDHKKKSDKRGMKPVPEHDIAATTGKEASLDLASQGPL